MQVLPQVGHTVHEDSPDRVAEVLAGHSSVFGGEEDRDIEVQLEPFTEIDTFER